MHRAADARSIDGALVGVRSRVEDGAPRSAQGPGAPRPRATSSATGRSSPASLGEPSREGCVPGFVAGVHAVAGASSLAMSSKLYAAPTAAPAEFRPGDTVGAQALEWS